MDEYLKNASQVVQKTSLPSISSLSIGCHFDSQSTLFNVLWKQTNYEISKARQFLTSYEFDKEKGIKRIPLFPIPYDAGILEKISPSRKLKACIKKQENTTSKKEEFVLEISSEDKISQTINLSTFDKHGSIHADPYFGGFEWTADEEKLVYVAEKKKPKNVGFFDRVPEEEKKDNGDKKDSKKDSKTVGEKFNYEESWGEMLSEVTNTCLVVVNIKDETVRIVDGIPDDICPAQPQWLGNKTLLFTGYNIQPFRLGLRVCECRESKVFCVAMNDDENETKEICPARKDVSDHSARISISMEKIVFIRRELKSTGNLHRGAEQLILYDIQNETEKVIFGNEELMFTHNLPNKCWLTDNIHVVFPNDRNGVQYAVVINTQTGNVLKEMECNTLYSVESDIIFMVCHKLDSAGATIKLGHFKNKELHIYQENPKKDEIIEYGRLIDQNNMVSYFLQPTNIKKPMPLVVIPHGGPHVMSTDAFRATCAAFVHLGYAVLLCNYRGSTGFSKDDLNALPGNVGDIDIKDVQNVVNMFLQQQGDAINRKQIFAFGGSHGGFIGAHLVGQYPDFYCAAALLNPVIDMAAMMMVTDIPDWAFVENGIPYEQGSIPSPEIYKEMVQRSPIIHLKNVKAPILLLIGGKDLRVPPSQGKSYYRLLKANGKTVKLLCYPEDSHPLLSIETSGDFFLNVCRWFKSHERE